MSAFVEDLYRSLLDDHHLSPDCEGDAARGMIAGALSGLRSLSPHGPPAVPEEIDGASREGIAIAAHDRWSRVKLSEGYKRGAALDLATRVHPDLTPFAELDEVGKKRWLALTGRVLDAVSCHPNSQEEIARVVHRAPIRALPSYLEMQRPKRTGEVRTEGLRADLNELLPHLGDEAWSAFRGRLRPEHLSAYPDIDPIYSALARWLGVDRRQLALSSGSDFAIGQVLRVFLEPSDRLLLPVPNYGMYSVYAQMCGAETIEFPCEPDFSLNVNRFIGTMEHRRPKIAVVAQPNGATGFALADDDVRRIVVAAEAQGTLVILDEAHVGFHADGWLARLPDHENLVLLRTFSKSGGLAGARFGFTISSLWIRELIDRARPAAEIGSVTALAVQVLLERPELMVASAKAVLAGKQWLADALERRGVTVFRGRGNFIQVLAKGKSPAVVETLKARGIRVRDQSGSAVLADWIRVTCGPPDLMAPVLTALEEVLP